MFKYFQNLEILRGFLCYVSLLRREAKLEVVLNQPGDYKYENIPIKTMGKSDQLALEKQHAVREKVLYETVSDKVLNVVSQFK